TAIALRLAGALRAGLGRAVAGGEAQLYPVCPDSLLHALGLGQGDQALARELGFASYLSVPLRAHDTTVGALALVRSDAGARVGPEAGARSAEAELGPARELGRRTGLAIENARLYAERSHVAQTLQRSLLPPALPDVPGLEIAALYRAAGEVLVGGDFYDVFP